MNNRATALPVRVCQCVLAAIVLLLSITPAIAGDTITYSYDVHGRLIQVSHSGTASNNGVNASYSYDNADNRANVTVGGVAGTITLSPTSLPNGTVGASYNKTITASGGTSPYTYTVSSGTLPAGLTLSSAGVLSGTPSATGTSTFTVKATDSASHTGTQSYSVTISAVTITLSPTSLPTGTVGTAYSQTITANGGTSPYTYTVSSGTLPSGLTLSSGGLLSGTPSAAATYTFTVKATDNASNSGTQSYSVTISAVTITLSPTSLLGGTIGTSYSQTITASGGTSPYTYSVSSGSLPTGLSLSSGGMLSGTPSQTGTWNFTVQAKDSMNNTGGVAYSLTISGSGSTLTISPTSLPSGMVGTSYSQTITASGGTSPYTYAVSSGSLPTSLSLNASTGAISGTPSASGTYSFTIKATDNASNTGSRAYSVFISTSTNQPPVANNGSATVKACGSANFDIVSTFGDYDPDGNNPISLVSVSGGILGTPTITSSTGIKYTAYASSGSDSFTYTIQDSLGATNTGTVNITISGGICMAPAP